jgi:hypothetical protein
MDLIGLDVNLAVTKSVLARYFHDALTRIRCCRRKRVARASRPQISRGVTDYATMRRTGAEI